MRIFLLLLIMLLQVSPTKSAEIFNLHTVDDIKFIAVGKKFGVDIERYIKIVARHEGYNEFEMQRFKRKVRNSLNSLNISDKVVFLLKGAPLGSAKFNFDNLAWQVCAPATIQYRPPHLRNDTHTIAIEMTWEDLFGRLQFCNTRMKRIGENFAPRGLPGIKLTLPVGDEIVAEKISDHRGDLLIDYFCNPLIPRRIRSHPSSQVQFIGCNSQGRYIRFYSQDESWEIEYFSNLNSFRKNFCGKPGCASHADEYYMSKYGASKRRKDTSPRGTYFPKPKPAPRNQ